MNECPHLIYHPTKGSKEWQELFQFWRTSPTHPNGQMIIAQLFTDCIDDNKFLNNDVPDTYVNRSL